MAKRETETGEIIKTVGAVLADLFPLFVEKWTEFHSRPALAELEREQARLERRTERLVNQIRWFYPVFFLLFAWNLLLTVFLFLK
ncbi:MAG: hypothetical protein H7A21_19785 [Spirochaetales bacterium]|nr:hypothetical protein [Leptospiraceae bacterium]MCP5483689.1 hypothetical protein [Spirochaetales bacterium]